MRWYVEIAPVGRGEPIEKLCLEASHWQPALQQARRARGEDVKLGGLSIEFQGDGCKAIDGRLRLAYEVSRAPDDAPLVEKPENAENTGEAAVARDEEASPKEKSRRARGGRKSKKRIRGAAPAGSKGVATTQVLGSTGDAEAGDDEARMAGDPESGGGEPSTRRSDTKKTVMGMGLEAGGDEAAKAPVPKAEEMVQPPSESAPPPAPYDTPSRREIAPNDDQPLSYREVSLAIELPMDLATLRAVVLHALEEEKSALDDAPAGRLVRIAVFDHVFRKVPGRPPLLTAQWSDWRRRVDLTFFPYADRPAGSLDAARDLLGKDELTSKEAARLTVSPALKAKAKKRSDEADGEEMRGEQKKAAEERERREREKAAEAERRKAEAREREETAAKRRDAEKEAATAKKLEEEERRRVEEARRALEAKRREDEDKRVEEARRATDEGSAKRASASSDQRSADATSPKVAASDQLPAETAAADDADDTTTAASGGQSRKSSRKRPMKTLADGTPRPGKPTSGRSRRSLSGRKRRSSAEPSAAGESIKAEAEAKPGQQPVGRVEITRHPALSFDENVLSRKQRDQRHEAARERADSIPPPPSIRGKRVKGDDLITDMFEAVAELFYLNDALDGADFVLRLAMEKLPSEAGLVSLFDIDHEQFVVVRQTGGSQSALLNRISDKAPLQRRALRKRQAVVVADVKDEPEAADPRWERMGVEVRSVICAPVEKAGRYLGLIELVNPYDGKAFRGTEGHALTYIGEQYADFLDQHGLLLDPDAVVASAEAMSR